MPDWIYHALESFHAFMDKASLLDLGLSLFVGAIGAYLVVAVHEAAHAWLHSSPGTECTRCASATRTT